MASLQSTILKFIIRRQNLLRRGVSDLPKMREEMEKVTARARLPKNVQVSAAEGCPTPAEWLTPPGAQPGQTLLYIHGGAWCLGSAATHRGLVAKLASACGVRALSINYRLAPEDPFPAALNDCLAAYEWLLGLAGGKVAVAGDSAGGNLTLALLVALRDAGKPLPVAAAAFSPATDLAMTGESAQTRLHLDPFFANLGPNSIISDYIQSHDPYDPLISPLYADLHGLPPLLIHVGDHEMLLDDSLRFGQRAAAAGVEAVTVVWPGMFHVFQMFDPILPEARKSIAEAATFLRARLNSSPSDQRNEKG